MTPVFSVFLTPVFRFLDSKGEDCGVTARDSFALSLVSKAFDLKNSNMDTDLEKKMTKMAAAFVVKKIKEEIKKRGEEEGIGEEGIGEDQTYPNLEGIFNINLMPGTKSSINGVKNLKYVCVLFHSGQQLFLTVEGKGKKGLRVDAEWFSLDELVEVHRRSVEATAMTGTAAKHRTLIEDFMAERGLVSSGDTDLCLPLQCGAEGKLR